MFVLEQNNLILYYKLNVISYIDIYLVFDIFITPVTRKIELAASTYIQG